MSSENEQQNNENGLLEELKMLTDNEEEKKLLDDIVSELSDIKDAMGEIKGADTSKIESLLLKISEKKEIIQNVDFSDLTKLLREIKDKIKEPQKIEFPKPADYTELLKKINEKKYFDKEDFLKELKDILKDALKITVYGGGGNKSHIKNVAGTVVNPATEDKQDDVIAELQKINSLVPAVYDYISLSYTGSNLTGVVFKTGGSGGTTVSTLTLGYDGSDNLITVTKT